MATEPDEVLTVPEAMRLLKISRDGIYNAIRRGELPAVRIGRKIRLGRRALLRFVNEGTVVERAR